MSSNENNSHPLDSHTREFLQHEKRLRGIAYRILGNLQEAEEIVQEVYLQSRKFNVNDTIKTPGALLTTLTVRRSLDLLKTAAKQREHYTGPWLPTPIASQWADTEINNIPQQPTETHNDPALQLEMSQSLSTAFMLLLERLSPLERAVFVLRQGFDLSYQEIAASVDQSADYCRQLYRRAQNHITQDKDRFETTEQKHQVVFNKFLAALANADIPAIKNLLADDAIAYSDGGGKAIAALRPIYGRDKVTRLFIGLNKNFTPVSSTRFCLINQLPGIILYDGDTAVSTLSAHIIEGEIKALYVTRNPDKLWHLSISE